MNDRPSGQHRGEEPVVIVQTVCESTKVPGEGQVGRWARAALRDVSGPVEVVIRIVEEAESAELNRTYRRKPGPTNVLSFPSDLPAELRHPLLGDLVICAPVVAREAREQGKDLAHHWAHMVVHGVLHLRGYDHQTGEQAATMESLEREILGRLGIDDPYAEREMPVAG